MIADKAAYDAEIENDAFIGSPTIVIDRMIEDGDVVFATGRLSAQRADGGTMRAAIAELLAFRGDLIARREAWVVPLPDEALGACGEDAAATRR